MDGRYFRMDSRSRICIFLLPLALIASSASAATGRWSLSPAVGAAHQDFTSSGFLVTLDLAFALTPAVDVGARGGYFDPGGCCSGESTDTHYGVLFARLHRADGDWQPFVEAGGGYYVVQNDTEPGWLVGIGVDRVLSARTTAFLGARYNSVNRPASGISPEFEEVEVGLRFHW